MSTKFTPGPWRINPQRAAGRRVFMPSDVIEITQGGSMTGLVACLYATNASLNGEIDRANAYLIAAAPQLYEALDYVLSAHGEQLHDAFDQAQRALAKARGDQHA